LSWHDAALALAGVIGSGVAVLHGNLTQRYMVRAIAQLADKRMTASIKSLVPILLHFSTFNWFLGGLALIANAIGLGRDSRLAIGLLVGSSYLHGALGNFWATRGRHPGWALYAIAVGLIALGVNGSGE